MFDIWSFLLQTLTVSGVAVLLLVVKTLFKDKLPPKWQFAVWSVLGLMMLLPAGLGGRYTLVRWQFVVEVVKSWVGDYRFTNVWFPFPVIKSIPKTVIQWVFAGYVFGVLLFVVRYAVSYIKLRCVLRMGKEPCSERMHRIQTLAAEQGVKRCKVIEVSELPGAFVCGVLRPVLVLPAGEDMDDKIILHELFHLKHKDALWSVVICLFRCFHWCNPLIVYCANRAINDMESRCDQYVLEHLEGEERRDYGHILLAMANERFSKTPGSTCINNGGKNIRERIEAIARFKKYPGGMKLVSVCVMIILAVPLVRGTNAASAHEFHDSARLSLASARSIPCTTFAGAFDTYGKAILERNGYYRTMCASEDMQEALWDEILENEERGIVPTWDSGLTEWTDTLSGYYIYNLKQCGENAYEGMLVVKLNYPPEGKAEEEGRMYLAVQNLRAEQQNGRWVINPLEEFRHVEVKEKSLQYGCTELPGITYAGESNNVRVEHWVQTVHTVENNVEGEGGFYIKSNFYYNTTPKPNAEFTEGGEGQSIRCIYLGSETEKDAVTQIGISLAPVYEGDSRPDDLTAALRGNMSGGSNAGEHFASREVVPGWGPEILLSGGGGSIDAKKVPELPDFYAADLYLNSEKVAEMELTLQKGDAE